MNERKFEELLRNIQAMIKCPHCGSFYLKENISIVGNMGEAVLVQLNCDTCKMPVMATIVAKGFESQGDVSYRSLQAPSFEAEISDDKPITADEIMELHSYLKDFNGDFEQAFGK